MPQTILLVEDDEDVLDILHYMLSDEGYSVIKSNGADACDLAEINQPGLILLDHRLQNLWGADICRQLKASPQTAHIPVIMISATMHLEQTAREAGADHLLKKPFDMDELLSLTVTALRARQQMHRPGIRANDCTRHGQPGAIKCKRKVCIRPGLIVYLKRNYRYMKKNSKPRGKLISALKTLGPGLVTGSSDDDPSGIATYSQVGAQFGFATLWTALITFPMMAAIQEMCARIGLVTSKGLTSTLRDHYPKWILWVMILFSFPAIILNIGADIAGMGAAANLIVPSVPAFAFSIVFTALILAAIIIFPYQKVAGILKWFCITLLVYLAVPFFTSVNWGDVLKATFLPQIKWSKDYLNALVAILGTTISPYLFFWQATMEAEDIQQKGGTLIVDKRMISKMREDVDTGMLFSNLVMFFIILTCGSVLYPHGITRIESVEQAATALKPIAGNLAYVLFSIGIIGTGFWRYRY